MTSTYPADIAKAVWDTPYHGARVLIWAEHIIKRFGREDASKFVYSRNVCPCDELGWHCDSCEYARNHDLCLHSIEWMHLSAIEREKIKECIKEKIKNEN